MLKRALVVALVVIWGNVTEPLRAEVGGILTDAEGVPIKKATLKINRPGGSTTIETDEDGLFNVNELEVTSGADAELQFRSLRFRGKVDIQEQWQSELKLLVLRGFSLATVTVTPTWNIWPSLEGDSEIRRAPEVTVGTNYTVHFDLAGVKYSDSIGTIEADPVLAAYLEHNRKIWVKPLIQGQGLRLLNTTPREHEVTLEKLRSPQSGEGLSLKALSERFAALAIEVPVAAEAPGKSIVGLALLDIDRRQVVGLVSVEIEVKAKPSASPTGIIANTVTGGESEPLGVAVGKEALFRLLSSGPEAHLGIGLFNLGGRETVVVVNKNGEIRSWTPRRSIREYVDDIDPKHFGLNRQLEFVHCPSWASLDCEEDYSQVASFFSQILFSDPTKTGRDEAKKAMEDLQGLGEVENVVPVVSVGYFNGSGTILPIPLGLLGVKRETAGGEEIVPLGTLATVTQPLPITRLPPAGGCAQEFTAILPSSLGLDGQDVRPDFDALLKPYRKLARHRSTHKELEVYFKEKPGTAERESLLLLAHHVDGFLSFEADFKPAYLAENMEREFAPGSVAVLIGCSVGGLDSLNRTMPLISTLNERGIDAMILSPFGVNAQLGARFAVHFAAEIEEARRYNRSLTLLNAFQSAIERTRGDASVTPFLNELNEFSVVGAGNLFLCPKKIEAAPVAPLAALTPPQAGQPQPTDPPIVDPAPEEPPPRVSSQRDSASRGCGHGRGQGRRLGGGSGTGGGGGGVKSGGRIGPFQRDFDGYGWGCCCCCN